MKLLLAVLMLFAGTMPAAAQWLDRPWPGIPRTADGKPDLTAPAPRGPDGRPDLTGVWNGPAPVARPDPATLQPWVTDLARRRQQEYYRMRPFFRCLPSGPETERSGGWKRFLQTPTAVAILNDDLTYRVIHLDGRELEADPSPSWMGYSVGRWDGDTLVVDSTGFNDKTWASRYGVSHTEALRITERYRRPDERSSEDWPGRLSDAANRAVSVSPDVLARYVGVYRGIYMGKERTYEVSLSGGQLIATIVGAYDAVGLGAAGLDRGVPRPLVPQSQTLFEGLGLGYRFIVDDEGVATDLMVIHVSGDYGYSRLR